MPTPRIRCILPLLLLAAASLPAQQNPPRLEAKLLAFEEAAKTNPIPAGGTLFLGSSSMEIWGKRFAPLSEQPLIFRGVGGTTYDFLLRNADRLLADCAPARVLVYSGDNDIGDGKGGEKAAETVTARARELVAKIHATHPNAVVYILGVKPSIKRADAAPVQALANAGLRNIAAEMPGKVVFVDTGTCLLGEDGKPDPANFAPDGLHLNAQGYAKWNALIAPLLAP
jgi:hypothetical protein